MGTTYECTCSECDARFTLQDDGGFRYTQWICSGCGTRVSLPRFAHRPPREGRDYPPLFGTRNYIPSAQIRDTEIKRFATHELAQLLSEPRRWPASGDRWDEYEIEHLLSIVAPCECDATWANTTLRQHCSHNGEDAPHPFSRCPSCDSKHFVFQRSDI